MSQNYAPQNWTNGSGLAINQDHLNHIELGIEAVDTAAQTDISNETIRAETVEGQLITEVSVLSSGVTGAQSAAIAASTPALVTSVWTSGVFAMGVNFVNALSSSVTGALPTPTKVGQFLAVIKDLSVNQVVISGTIEGISSTRTLVLPNESFVFEAETLSSWRIFAGNKTLSSLDTRFGNGWNVVTNPKFAGGAKGDGRQVADGAMSNGSPIVTSATAVFTASDIGKQITVGDNGGTFIGTAVIGTILSVQSITQATLSANAPHALTNVQININTNDSSSIQAAIDDMLAKGGGTVFVPRGDYFCNVILKQGVTLLGSPGVYGKASRTVGVTFRSNTGIIVDTPDPASVTYSVGVVGLNFEGQYSGASNGVRFRNTWWSSLIGCEFDGFTDQGFLQVGGVASQIRQILSVNTLTNRTRGSVNGSFEVYGSDHMIDSVEASSGQGLGLSISYPNCQGFVNGSTNSFLTKCLGEGSDGGIYTSGNYNRYSACRADDNNGNGWTTTGRFNTLSSCHGVGNGAAANNTYQDFDTSGYGNNFGECVGVQTAGNVVQYTFHDTNSNAIPNLYAATCLGNDFGTAMFNFKSPSINASDAVLLTSGLETIARDKVAFSISANACTLPSGDLKGTVSMASTAFTATKVSVRTSSTAAAATPTLCRVGIYTVDNSNNGTLVASIVNDTTLFAATNTEYVRNLSASLNIIPGVRYAILVLVVTVVATPTFNGFPNSPEYGPATSTTAPTLGIRFPAQSDLPASFTLGNLIQNAGLIYAKLLP